MGLVPGWSFVDKFGENPDIDGPFEDIWDGGGNYVTPTVARIHDVQSNNIADVGTLVSSGAATGGSVYTLVDTGATFVTDGVQIGDKILNDSKCAWGNISSIDSETQVTIVFGMRYPSNGLIDGPFEAGDDYRIFRDASTGASCLWIQGLDANFLPKNEFVILNGTTPVPTVNLYIRQFRARVFTSGNAGAIGTVTSTAQTDGTVSCQVINGNNQTLMAIYTIPIDKEGFILNWWASLSKKQAANSIVHFRAGQIPGVGYIQQTRSVSSTGSSEFNHKFEVPLRITGAADIWMEADASTTDIGVSGGFAILMRQRPNTNAPSFEACQPGVWTKVASGVCCGTVYVTDGEERYLQTYRAQGATPPVNGDPTEGIRLDAGPDGNQIESLEPIDVYIYVTTADAGEVQVRL
jgi:hypothetical protein